jgi:ribosomal protein S18 acetylase RimI-like enzyme
MNTPIEKVTEPTQELHLALQRLIPQLGAHKVIPTWDEFCALVKSEASLLLAARDSDESNEIVGILCLTIYRVPTGIRSIIEDVIVDEKMRGMGIGRALVSQAIQIAREAGASGVSLTSNPQREAANQLYRSLGFEPRKTNPYFYKL